MSDHEEDLEDGSSTCSKCSYQTTSRADLIKHVSIAHGVIENTQEAPDIHRNENEGFRCNICNIHFTSKNELNSHKKESHITYKPCNKYQSKRCEYDSECNFSHVILKENEQICYKCGDIVTSKTELYNHLKQKPGQTPCHKFQQNTCSYSSQDCLYRHTMNNHAQRNHNAASQPVNRDFQNIHQSPAPPEWPTIGGRKKTIIPNEEILKRMMMIEESLRDLKNLVVQN